MDDNSFTVTSAKSEKIVGSLIFFLFCVPFLIIGLLIPGKVILKVIAVIVFLFGLFYFLSSILEYVTVSENVIKGRTISGKKYEIKLPDIKKVTVTVRIISGLNNYSIMIYSDIRNVAVNHTMKNFDKMAELICKKYDTDDRDINILNDDSLDSLREYLSSRETLNNKK